MERDRLVAAIHDMGRDHNHATLSPYGICETYWEVGLAVEAVSDHDRVTVSAATLGRRSNASRDLRDLSGTVDLRVVAHCWTCHRSLVSTTTLQAGLALPALPRLIYPLCTDLVGQPCWKLEDQSACAAWLAEWCRDRGSEGVTVAEAYCAAQEGGFCPPGRLEWVIRKLELDLEHAAEGGYSFWIESKRLAPLHRRYDKDGFHVTVTRKLDTLPTRIEHRGRLLTLPVGHPWRNW